MRNALVTLVCCCLLCPAALAAAGSYSPVDGAFDHEGRAPSRGHIGPSRSSAVGDFHREAMENPDYALADGLLNATWGVLKKNLSVHEYENVLQEQRRWLGEGRDHAARRYMDEMSETRAYARATMDRVHELTRRIGVIPRSGRYSAAWGSFRATVNGGSVFVEGDAYRGQNSCGYEGTGSMGNGWIRMAHDDFPDFYILFTPYGAEIFYNTGGVNQGCGLGVEFGGTYSRN